MLKKIVAFVLTIFWASVVYLIISSLYFSGK